MNKKQLASDIVLNEKLWCGGELKTRKQIFDELVAEGLDRQSVDRYLFYLAQHQPQEKMACLGLVSPTVQFDVIIGYSCDECGASCGPDEELVHYVARKKKSRRMG